MTNERVTKKSLILDEPTTDFNSEDNQNKKLQDLKSQYYMKSKFQSERSTKFVESLMETIGFQSKDTKMSFKFYDQIQSLPDVNITPENFTTILINLAKAAQKQYQLSHHFFKNLENVLDHLEKGIVAKMLVYIKIKLETFDVCTNLDNIYDAIEDCLINMKGPILSILLEWYDYMCKKYERDLYKPHRDIFVQHFREDLKCMRDFMSNVIYHLFKTWFRVIITHESNIYTSITQIFVTKILTWHKKWSGLYRLALKRLGKSQVCSRKLNFVNYKRAFAKTIYYIKVYYSEYALKPKLQTLILIFKSFQEQAKMENLTLNSNQQNSLLDEQQHVLLENCILASQKNGIYESIEYMELLCESSIDQQSIFLKLNISEFQKLFKRCAKNLKFFQE